MEAGAKEIAIFGAVSETFTMKNINCTVAESNVIFSKVAKAALDKGLRVRGYLSCVCGCPYEGAVHPTAVAKVCCVKKKHWLLLREDLKTLMTSLYSRLKNLDYSHQYDA
jgi:isopropylmalate/homocitrate/citramalate synthase